MYRAASNKQYLHDHINIMSMFKEIKIKNKTNDYFYRNIATIFGFSNY